MTFLRHKTGNKHTKIKLAQSYRFYFYVFFPMVQIFKLRYFPHMVYCGYFHILISLKMIPNKFIQLRLFSLLKFC